MPTTNVLAAGEGGYQEFTLHGGEWFILVGSALTALLALGVGVVLTQGVLQKDEGSPSMVAIAKAIQEGAVTYLRRQFRTIGIILVPLLIIVFLTSTAIDKPDDESALTFIQSGTFRSLGFLAGCLFSALTGFIGMGLAVRGNVRTAAAARGGKLAPALEVAFRTGGVAGMFCVGFGLLGATTIMMIFQNTSSAILIGFGFGGSLIALFLRVGGGIFTKAADVGADLVGKVEAGIPEDDPRNPATIADNVGDNVGDCAGMASDLFESYEVTLVAAIILGVPAFQRLFPDQPALWAAGALFPLAARAVGVLASIVGVFMVRARESDRSALAPINRGFATAGGLTVLGTLVLALVYVGNPDDSTISNPGWRLFGAVVIGLVLAQLISRITEYFTSTEQKPVREIADSTATGPATTVLSGTSSGMESSVWAILSIAAAIGAAIALGGGDVPFSLYLVALCGMGMLATTGVVVSEDTFGPVADNAQGIAEMTGELEGDAEKVMVGLDAVGNTTKAVTKGFAIGSAVIAAVALFASFVEISATEVVSSEILDAAEDTAQGIFGVVPINVADPKVFIGLLIGGAVPFLFSSLAIRAVSRSAGVVVQEVRNQFADGKIMRGEKEPDHGPVIDICTRASLRELTTPALLAVLTPVIVGFGLGYTALGGFLAAVILVGQLMANYLSNSGGAWDNAKKYIEDGNHGGKGSEAHMAAVIGDTVGDPFKDTAGPALNPLIKVMNLISLLILPAVIAWSDVPEDDFLNPSPTSGGLAVAAVALLVLLGAIAFSKRPAQLLAEDGDQPAGPATGGSNGGTDASVDLSGSETTESAEPATEPTG